MTVDEEIELEVNGHYTSVKNDDDLSNNTAVDEEIESAVKAVPCESRNSNKEVNKGEAEHTSNGHSDVEGTETRKTKLWGGAFVSEMEECDGDLAKYSDNFAVEGLSHAMDSSNGLLRSGFWLLAFALIGAFVIWLCIPIVEGYKKKSVVTSIDQVSGSGGLPLPIVTVCPNGLGFRCDCLLWRRLHCRYANDVKNIEWMAKMDQMACWNNFNLDGQRPVWIDPKCSDFDENSTAELSDPCGPLPSDIERDSVFAKGTGESLYQTIVSRESSPEGPYVKIEELIFYATQYLDDRVHFFRTFNLQKESIPKEWITYRFANWGRLQFCAQITPPRDSVDAKQHSEGIMHGLTVVVSGLSEMTPLFEMKHSNSIVQVHIDLNGEPITGKENSYFDEGMHLIQPSEFFAVPASTVLTVEYKSKKFQRYKGWGSRASQNCEDTPHPRDVCTLYSLLEDASDLCHCKEPELIPRSPVFGCELLNVGCVSDKIFGSDSRNQVSLEKCPFPCTKTEANIVSRTASALSEGKAIFFRKELNATKEELNRDQTAVIQIAYRSLDIEQVVEKPSTSFGAMMGTIGGNVGLWCGLSFLTIVEVLEFSIVACLFGRRVRRRS